MEVRSVRRRNFSPIEASLLKGIALNCPSPLADGESGLGTRLGCQRHLPLATTEAEGAEPGGPSGVIHPKMLQKMLEAGPSLNLKCYISTLK
ncbi:unnamed protein product [Merluccius merluccius]